MFEKQNYSATPNKLLDEYMRSLSGSELKLTLMVIRQTVGWQKPSDWITTGQFMAKTGLSNRCVIDGLRSLVTKKIIVVTFICEKCKTILETEDENGNHKVEIPFECPICGSKEHPTKYYQLNVNYVSNEKQKLPEASAESSQPTALKVHDPMNLVHSPCEESSQGPMNLVHTQKKLLKETLTKSISQLENLTKEDPEADWENFDILEERENFEKKEPEEEKREKDFRLIKEQEPNQAETEGTDGVDKFTAGLLGEIGNPSAFAEEKPKNEDKSTEKEIKDLLNSCMAHGWNIQTNDNDTEFVKEMMKYAYKDVEASCDDRMKINRPAIPKLFPKWVLDGLRSGIKAKRPTQLEKEAFLENELEKHYQNGNGDKVLCRDVINRLYSVISIAGIMENRYQKVINWCEWQY